MERRTTTEERATEALDDRPTPRRNRRPRFDRDEATERLRRDEEATERLGGRTEVRHAPRVLDRYRLERRLGAGGFGVVWLAFDEKLEREVAVKVIQREGDEPVPQRAAREARVAARLNHPGIVALYELASDDEAVYLVSELVPGRTLAELIRVGAVSDRDVARIGSALCDALAHAHQRKVIHRDVKPQNVIVVAEPAAGAGFAKLADFGVAHLASGDPLTRTGDVVGTLAYMAPEQAEGERVTSAADVYSLALTLYEAWTGDNPVRAGSPMGTARRLGTLLPPLHTRRRDLPADLCRTIDAALDPDPERRPPLRALRSALDNVDPELSDEGGLVEPGTLERLGLGRRRREHRGLFALPPRGTRGARIAGRAGAGAAMGGLVAYAVHVADASAPVSPAAAALVAALAVAALPRVAWLVVAAAICTWLALPHAGLSGLALVVLVAAAIVPPLLLRAGVLWSVPALAPLLGLAGLAPLFIAAAGLASTMWRRAGLAAAGFVWLALVEVASGKTLLYGAPAKATSLHEWESSTSAAASHALAPLVTSGALLPAVAWALLAPALTLLVRGRSLTLDLAGAAVWVAGVVAAHQAVGRVLSHHGQLSHAHGLWAGALLGAVAAVTAAGAGLVRRPVAEPALPRMAER
jgi:hypothetical protein